MSKNRSVTDIKPNNGSVVDTTPRNRSVIDTKPANLGGFNFETEILYTQILGAGMYMGIPSITYPTAGTVQSPFSP